MFRVLTFADGSFERLAETESDDEVVAELEGDDVGGADVPGLPAGVV